MGTKVGEPNKKLLVLVDAWGVVCNDHAPTDPFDPQGVSNSLVWIKLSSILRWSRVGFKYCILIFKSQDWQSLIIQHLTQRRWWRLTTMMLPSLMIPVMLMIPVLLQKGPPLTSQGLRHTHPCNESSWSQQWMIIIILWLSGEKPLPLVEIQQNLSWSAWGEENPGRLGQITQNAPDVVKKWRPLF